MRDGEFFGLNNMMIAILAIVILAIMALLLFGLIEPSSEAAAGFGQQAAGVFE